MNRLLNPRTEGIQLATAETIRTHPYSGNDAWVCQSGDLVMQRLPSEPVGAAEVEVEVKSIGLCRTDLYAIAGSIPVYKDSFIPGHEFSGVIKRIGKHVRGVSVGDRVAVNPVVPCEDCPVCKAELFHRCSKARLMGVDLPGACRKQIVLPRNRVWPLPISCEFERAVFAEPVAATLGILNAEISADMRGAIIGSGRIAELARRVLCHKQFKFVSLYSLEESELLEADQFDFVVETQANTELLIQMIRLVKPMGTLILKSRQLNPISFDLRTAVAKQPRMEVVYYGMFSEAIRLLTDDSFLLDDLIGERFQLEEFKSAINYANTDVGRKTILSLKEQ